MKKSLDQQLLENLASNLTDLWEDWNKVNHHDKTPGLSQKAVNAYRREHPGSKLQTAVTTKPSKLKPGSKAAKRRKSFCARMSGNKGPMKKPNGKPTPKALALRRWNCESIEQMAQMIVEGAKMIAEIKKGAKDSNGFTKCWPGKHAEGTKKGRNGGQVRNCVPNEGVAEGKINPAGLNHTQQIGDYVYRAKALNGSDKGEIEMTAYDGKKSIADTVFMPYGSGGRMISGQTYVHPAYRGKGVAAGMYAYLRMLGFKIEPSGIRTDAGKAMWDKWEKAGDAKYLSKGVAEGGAQQAAIAKKASGKYTKDGQRKK